jgi:hypothetical protein
MRWEPSFNNSIAECSISNEDIQITPLVGSLTRNNQPVQRVDQNEANFLDSSLEIDQTVTLKQLLATNAPRKHQRVQFGAGKWMLNPTIAMTLLMYDIQNFRTYKCLSTNWNFLVQEGMD